MSLRSKACEGRGGSASAREGPVAANADEGKRLQSECRCPLPLSLPAVRWPLSLSAVRCPLSLSAVRWPLSLAAVAGRSLPAGVGR
jgi:hypothetical protein